MDKWISRLITSVRFFCAYMHKQGAMLPYGFAYPLDTGRLWTMDNPMNRNATLCPQFTAALRLELQVLILKIYKSFFWEWWFVTADFSWKIRRCKSDKPKGCQVGRWCLIDASVFADLHIPRFPLLHRALVNFWQNLPTIERNFTTTTSSVFSAAPEHYILLARCQLMKNPELKRAVGHSEPSMSLEYIDISPDQLSKAAVQAFWRLLTTVLILH